MYYHEKYTTLFFLLQDGLDSRYYQKTGHDIIIVLTIPVRLFSSLFCPVYESIISVIIDAVGVTAEYFTCRRLDVVFIFGFTTGKLDFVDAYAIIDIRGLFCERNVTF